MYVQNEENYNENDFADKPIVVNKVESPQTL